MIQSVRYITLLIKHTTNSLSVLYYILVCALALKTTGFHFDAITSRKNKTDLKLFIDPLDSFAFQFSSMCLFCVTSLALKRNTEAAYR